MGRLLSLIVLTAGLAAVVAILVMARDELAVQAHKAVPEQTEKRDGETIAKTGAEPEKPVRPIEPQVFVPPFGRQTAGLERLPARAPLSKPKEKEKVEGLLLSLPEIDAPGIVTFPQGKVVLRGLEPMDADLVCGTGDAAWPCGMMALTALRRFVRGRSLFCSITDQDWHGEVTARCDLGKEDIAAWLVRNGWAKAKAGSEYADLAHTAEADGAGIFGSDPRNLPE